MDRHDVTEGGGTLLDGDRVPTLVLRRSGRDANRLLRHLAGSTVVDAIATGPDDLLRPSLRWPADPRVQPLAVLALFAERPGAVEVVAQLARHLRSVPLVVVADGSREFALALLDAGATEVVEVEHLSGAALETALVEAVRPSLAAMVHISDHEQEPVDLVGLHSGDLAVPG